MKKWTWLLIPLLVMSCAAPEKEPTADEKEAVSEWNGYFMWRSSPYQVGTIENWKLYDDGSCSGRWVAGDLFSLPVSGAYELSGDTYDFEFSGTASGPGIGSSAFTAFGSGTMFEAHGTGTYTIVFVNPIWDDQIDETWEVISGTPRFSSYAVETFPNEGGGGGVYVDTVLNLYNSGGLLINTDDGGAAPYSLIDHSFLRNQTYFIEVRPFSGLGTGYYSLLVDETGGGSSAGTPATDAGEPDDTREQAVPMSLDTVYDRYLSAGDADWFEITIP